MLAIFLYLRNHLHEFDNAETDSQDLIQWYGAKDNYKIIFTLLSAKKADDKIFVCKFSKNVKSKLYHIVNSMTRGPTV